jgi:acetylornithine/LysW-gamma-L-lysine aminotransferase
VPFNNLTKLTENLSNKTAGVILEIVQGEGGVHIGDKGYFENVRALCEESGTLLIIDEIQTGFCRTGRMFASNHFDLEPDIMCLAKAIAGGLPMGAVLCSEKVAIPVGKHGSTFGGNPLVCAAAIAAIETMLENRLDEQAREKGEYFVKKFKEHDLEKVRQVRSLGLMVGIELKEKSTPYLLKLLDKGVLALPAGATVLRLLPPLTISHEELDTVIEKLVEVLTL